MTAPITTPIDLEALKAAAEAATPGPWIRSGCRRKMGEEDCIMVGPDGFLIAALPIGQPRDHAGAFKDAAFIALWNPATALHLLSLLAEKAAAPLRVVAAANRVNLEPEASGDPRAVPVIVSAPPPARHANLFAIMPDGPYPGGGDSGFLLSDGSFADRVRAADVAVTAGQVKREALRHLELFSEDLW